MEWKEGVWDFDSILRKTQLMHNKTRKTHIYPPDTTLNLGIDFTEDRCGSCLCIVSKQDYS